MAPLQYLWQHHLVITIVTTSVKLLSATLKYHTKIYHTRILKYRAVIKFVPHENVEYCRFILKSLRKIVKYFKMATPTKQVLIRRIVNRRVRVFSFIHFRSRLPCVLSCVGDRLSDSLGTIFRISVPLCGPI